MTLSNWLQSRGEDGAAPQTDPQLDGLHERLLQIADQAFADGATQVAFDLVATVVQRQVNRKSLMHLAGVLMRTGQFAEAANTYRRVIVDYPHDENHTVYRSLGSAEAAAGNLEAAVEALQVAVCSSAEPQDAAYGLASCFAYMRKFDAANEIFARNIPIPLYENRQTSTRIIRLVADRSAIPAPDPKGLSLKREVHFNWDNSISAMKIDDCEAVQFIACDANYFSLFARPVCRSVVERSGVKLALHFHVVNPTQSISAHIADLRRDFQLPIVYSSETIDLHQLSSEQAKTVCSCVRYLVLPDILEHYQKTILVTDADQLIASGLHSFFAGVKAHDVGLLFFPTGRDNLLSLVSASVCVVNPSRGGRAFASAVRNYLLERLSDRESISWHLDQAGLAAIYLASGDIDFHLFEPKIMKSTITLKRSSDAPDPETLFWSVTYSIQGNAYKLGEIAFR
jgi:hypothetical protein